MSSRRAMPALLGAGLAFLSVAAFGADPEMSPQARQALKFVSGLRERGYHDLALEYLEELRKSPDAPADLKVTLDFQVGRGLLEEATTTNDIEKKTALLDEARTKLDGFATRNPKHPLAPEALMQLARLNIERGHTALLQSKDVKGPEAQAKLGAARAAFAEARSAYGRAIPTLKAAYESFPKFIPEDNTKRREERTRAHEALMDAMLQRAVVDYEEAQTWPAEANERKALLDKGIAAFEGLYKDYRGQLAGLSARMLQGKCYEERGDLGAAMGIYIELLGHTVRGDAQFNEMRRRVAYYRIIVEGKRKEYALAVDEAAQWLNQNPRQRTNEYGLGVQLELAKNLLAQLPEMKDTDREEAMRKATDRLNEVVRYFSPFKPEALELLRKYRPKSTLTASQIANMTYDEAMNQADSAMSTHEWDRAILLFKQAIKRADPAKDIAKANKARYFLAYCYYSSQRYYEAAAIADHMARRYPQREWSDKVADFGIASYTMAYNTYAQRDRASDLANLLDFARYTAATWPETDQGDSAKETLGQALGGQGKWEEAAKALESIRPNSPRRLDAQVRAGDYHWRIAQRLRDEGKTAEADAQEKTAYELTASALDARKKAGTAPTDPSLIVNTNALAEILRGLGKPKEALALLEPLSQALAGQTLSAEVAPLYEGLLTVMLQAHIGDGQSDKAIADMKTLEKTGISREKLTQLYLQLSRSLKTQMHAQQSRKDMAGYKRTQDAYKQFLFALAGSQAGQSFESLRFAGVEMLSLDLPKEGEEVFNRMLKTYGKDPEFLKDPKSAAKLFFLNLDKAQSLRKQRKFDDALKLDDELITKYPREAGPLMERGFLLEDWARSERSPGRWNSSFAYWKARAAQMDRGRPRRVEYYECVYHMAVALQALDRKADAAKTLRGVMTLSPSVGGAEMKAKYQALLSQLGS